MAHEFEVRIAQKVRDVVLGAGEEVVDAKHIVALGQQPFAQVRAQKPRTARDQYPFHRKTVPPARQEMCAEPTTP